MSTPSSREKARSEVLAWEELGESDPLWAIVSRPEMRGRRWKVDEFFQTGEERVKELFRRVTCLTSLPAAGRALDFGCGVGRLTQALARRFAEVVGIDAAASMIREANRLNRYPERVRYFVNQSDELSQFSSGSFDFILSDIVLQHIRRRAALHYLGEFVRVLRPGGYMVFQVPSGPASRWIRWIPVRISDPAFNLGRSFARRLRRLDLPAWESHWIPPGQARAMVERAGGQLLKVLDEPPIHGRLENHLYLAGRSP
jgi:SAM-dependent methyltransferase